MPKSELAVHVRLRRQWVFKAATVLGRVLVPFSQRAAYGVLNGAIGLMFAEISTDGKHWTRMPIDRIRVGPSDDDDDDGGYTALDRMRDGHIRSTWERNVLGRHSTV